MEFKELSQLMSGLEDTSSRLELTSMVSEFIKEVDDVDLTSIVLFLRGRVYPLHDSREIGVAEKLMIKALSQVSGETEKQVLDRLREVGDAGEVAEEILVNKPQTTLFTESLTVRKVSETLQKLGGIGGKGSIQRKLGYIKEILSAATPLDARYVVRLILGDLRLGVGEGTIRDAIAQAWDVPKEKVENAFNLRGDLGEAALTAKNKGEKGLDEVRMSPGRPVRVMLAQKAESMEAVFEKYPKLQVEVKYDGARIQAHKWDDKIRLYTRRLEDVTKQFPEITEACRKNLTPRSCIIEGEVVAVQDFQTRKPMPFQNLSRRIKRKYDIPAIRKEIPVEVNFFDLIYLEGAMHTKTPFGERRRMLEESVKPTESFRLAEKIIEEDAGKVEEFYQKSLEMGHEGVMLKVLDAPYKPGSRVGYMYKIKPVMETLDLVLTGATWGEGRRAKWLGSYRLSILDEATGELLEVGRMATGFNDQQLEEMTNRAKKLITKTEGQEVDLKPEIVVEVAYEEIQKSPTYDSGHALRFPRLVRFRDDKSVQDADTLARLESIMKKTG